MTKLLIVSLAATSIVACGKHSANPFKAAMKNAQARELSGTFQSECLGNKTEAAATALLNGSFGEAIKSQRVQLIFPTKGLGEEITRKEVHYTGSECDGEAYTFEEKGIYKVGPKTSQDRELRDLDITFNEVNVTMNAESAADAANKARLCGRTDWNKDSKEVNVTDHATDKLCYNATYKDGRRPLSLSYRTDDDKLILSKDNKQIVTASERSKTEAATFKKK